MKNEDKKQKDEDVKENQPAWVRKKKPSTEKGDGLEEYIRADPNLKPGEVEKDEEEKDHREQKNKNKMKEHEKRSDKIHKQQQEPPGYETQLDPAPLSIRDGYKGSGKLKDKVALITGGDSGIGRAVAIHFAREGADVAVIYLEESRDARDTREMVEKEGRKCLLIEGDIRNREFCKEAVAKTVDTFGKLNILVNHAGEQHPESRPEDIDPDLMERTYQTNIFAMFYMTQPALKHLNEYDCIINTSSVTAYAGSSHLIDYSGTNGAIMSFTRSLAKNLVNRKIRVNGVAPGPIWTPLIPSTFGSEKVGKFGENTPMQRAGQPSEVAPAYVYLASEDASYVTGQMLHVDGGMSVQS